MRPEHNELPEAAPEAHAPDAEAPNPRRGKPYYTPPGYGVMSVCQPPAVPYGTYFSDAPSTTRAEPDYREMTAALFQRVVGVRRQIADDRREIDRLRRETRAILDSLPAFA
ncbi:MAG: hypothetical protein AVDCRST_MAG89-3819 [uncultured Gemmatimonadetes bacterium]|uniref:Uncharacterized protein n=1 Tax=uncultured Gemmatimonadota bacterium TaxID=203437 RepID=A0A6J4MKC4_9BACT|nr:MAG: hypothetical protein AVDCRST_MAG89-3819 [uncultured Gemmatimonadota bacterium]